MQIVLIFLLVFALLLVVLFLLPDDAQREPLRAPADADDDLVARLRAWSSASAAVPTALAVWLETLPADHAAVVTRFIAQFCQDMGFSLRGVLDGEYAKRDLAPALEQVVIHIIAATQLIFDARAELLPYAQERAATPPVKAPALRPLVARGRASVAGALARAGLRPQTP